MGRQREQPKEEFRRHGASGWVANSWTVSQHEEIGGNHRLVFRETGLGHWKMCPVFVDGRNPASILQQLQSASWRRHKEPAPYPIMSMIFQSPELWVVTPPEQDEVEGFVKAFMAPVLPSTVGLTVITEVEIVVGVGTTTLAAAIGAFIALTAVALSYMLARAAMIGYSEHPDTKRRHRNSQCVAALLQIINEVKEDYYSGWPVNRALQTGDETGRIKRNYWSRR